MKIFAIATALLACSASTACTNYGTTGGAIDGPGYIGTRGGAVENRVVDECQQQQRATVGTTGGAIDCPPRRGPGFGTPNQGQFGTSGGAVSNHGTSGGARNGYGW